MLSERRAYNLQLNKLHEHVYLLFISHKTSLGFRLQTIL